MANEKLDITILCKVVDNFGDIGFVYRLARAISNLCNGESLPLAHTSLFATPSPRGKAPKTPRCSLNLRIVVDNLKSFSLLEPKINPNLDEQIVNDWKILNWNADSVCLSEFRKNPPQIILECFECGRPDWLENLLFIEKVPNVVHIIMIDYLTAEPYAETFHKLKSLTRSARVQKVNFMPGFTEKTGGLIGVRNEELEVRREELGVREEELGGKLSLRDISSQFAFGQTGRRSKMPNMMNESQRLRRHCEVVSKAERRSNLIDEANSFNAVMFGYPRDYSPVVRSLAKFANSLKNRGKNLNILLARGAGFDSFKKAYCGELGVRREELGVREEELGGKLTSRDISSQFAFGQTGRRSKMPNMMNESQRLRRHCEAESKAERRNNLIDEANYLKSNETSLNSQFSTLDFQLTELSFLPQTEWDSLLFNSPLLFIRGEDSLSRACLCGVPFVWNAYPQSEEYQLVKVNALLERMKRHFSEQDFFVIQKCWQVYNTTNASAQEVENSLDTFLKNYDSLCSGFRKFSASLVKNGDFAEHLLEFICDI